MHFAVFDEEDVRASRLSHVATIVEEQCVRAAFGFCGVFGHRADHVETSGLCSGRDGFGRRALPFRDVQLCAFHLCVAVVGTPSPCGHSHANWVASGCNTHVFARATPCNNADVCVGQAVRIQNSFLRSFDLFNGVGDRHVEHFARFQQTLRVLDGFEDFAVVSALAFENGRCVVQRMGQNMDIRVTPIDQLAVHPDFTVTIIIASHSAPSAFHLFLNALRFLS